MSSASGKNEVAVVPESSEEPIHRPMKIMDKIVDYQQQQKQKQEQEPSSSPSPLPAVSLEFFPPKSQDGVLVSPLDSYMQLHFFQLGGVIQIIIVVVVVAVVVNVLLSHYCLPHSEPPYIVLFTITIYIYIYICM
jgi:hypothetical protein